MSVKQVSVFMENREGRLSKVMKTLADEQINVASLSMAETEDYGVLRLIVSKPERALEVLKEHEISAKLTNVVAVKISNEIGSFNQLLKPLENLNIEYLYVLSTKSYVSMILKIADVVTAEKQLTDAGYELLSEEEAYK
ncbi:MAG: ACT domain-containing protein [Clostridia bacterium]|nr:ACT domain-containing protein [Clostridia bacterium]